MPHRKKAAIATVFSDVNLIEQLKNCASNVRLSVHAHGPATADVDDPTPVPRLDYTFTCDCGGSFYIALQRENDNWGPKSVDESGLGQTRLFRGRTRSTATRDRQRSRWPGFDEQADSQLSETRENSAKWPVLPVDIVSGVRIELTTRGFSIHCSTD
jgi:hypothetical protein